MNNFTLRTISAAIYVAIIVVCLLAGTWPAFGLLFMFTLLCLWEYKSILLTDLSFGQKTLFILFGLYLFTVLSFWHFMYIPRIYYGLALILTVLIFIVELFHKNQAPFDMIGRQLTGLIYIPVSLGLLFGLGYQKFLYLNGEITYNGFLVLTIFILIWANDVFAYLIGRWLGRRPLLSRVSPKKTVEGFVAGLIFTVIASILIYLWKPNLTLFQSAILAIVVCFAATLGDLIESMLKRSFDIKDSGTLIPGHGGILDRLDATLITAWFAYFFFQVF